MRSQRKYLLFAAIVGTTVLIPLSLPARPFSEERILCARKDDKRGSLMDQLQLTPQQQEILMKRRQEQRTSRQELYRQMREKRAALQEEIGKPQSDAARINDLTQDISTMQARQLDEKVEELMELKRILTPQQYQKFQEKVGDVKSKRRRHE